MRVNTVSLYTFQYRGCNAIMLPFGNSKLHDKAAIRQENTDLRVFHHHIYEYKKGIRNLILTTEKSKYRNSIENRLQHEKIDYVIHDIGNDKINVYFGEKSCVNVVKTLNPKLNELSPEQDFILGIMLGYDRVKQCDRYLKMKRERTLRPSGW